MAGLDSARRAQIGAARRAKTREALIEGALETVSDSRIDDLTIHDFIAAAGVARGTYYNHFRTKEALLTAMAGYVAEAVDQELDRLLGREEDPMRRFPIAIREFVAQCSARPSWGWILVESMPEQPGGWSERMRSTLRRSIRHGITSGVFQVSDEDAAVAMTFGSLRESIRIALTQEVSDGFADAVSQMTLQALGVTPEDAARAVRDSKS